MSVFQKDFYVCGFSTSHIGNKDKLYSLISGRDTMATSLNLTVKSTSSGTNNAQGGCIPYVITKFTSVLHVTGERNVLVVR